jgi:hypothetical protein
MVKFDAHLHGTLRNGGYSTAQIQEIQRRFNFERDYLAVLRDDVAKNLAPAIYTDLSTRLYNTGLDSGAFFTSCSCFFSKSGPIQVIRSAICWLTALP